MKKVILFILFILLIILYSCGSSNVMSKKEWDDDDGQTAINIGDSTWETADMKKEELAEDTVVYYQDTIVEVGSEGQTGEAPSEQPIEITNTEETNTITTTGEIQTEFGTLVYQIDSIFYYNELTRVVAKISNKKYIKITPDIISQFTPDTNNLKLTNIETSEIMNMKLFEITPNTFVITPLFSRNLEVNEGWTTWEWSVLPITKGTFNLRMIVIIKNSNGSNVDKTVFDKPINVLVKDKLAWYIELFNNSLGLLQDYWFVLTVLLIPLGRWIYKKWKKYKKNKN